MSARRPKWLRKHRPKMGTKKRGRWYALHDVCRVVAEEQGWWDAFFGQGGWSPSDGGGPPVGLYGTGTDEP